MKRFLKELGKFILVGLLVTLIVAVTILFNPRVLLDIIILLIIVCGGLFIGALKHKIKKSWCVYTCIWTLLLFYLLSIQ